MSFELDFTGVNAAGSVNRPIPNKGYYRVRVLSVIQRETNAGNQRIEFNMVVDEGKHKGCTVRDGLNILNREELGDEKYFQRMSFWKTALLSFGISESKLAGKVTDKKLTLLDWCKKHCTGKVGYFFYEPALDDHSWPTKKLLTQGQYDTLVALDGNFEDEMQAIEVEAAPVVTPATPTPVPSNGAEDPLDFINI